MLNHHFDVLKTTTSKRVTIYYSIALCGLLWVTSCAFGQPTPFTQATVDWGQCTSSRAHNKQCGTITYDTSNLQVESAIARYPALVNHNKPAIFFIAGGPGQSAVDYADRVQAIFNALNREHDLVFIDQLGTGEKGYHCTLPKERKQQTPQQNTQLLLDALGACLQTQQTTLPASLIGTHSAVHQLEASRQALQYNKVNLVAVSYGTRVALAYIQHYPDSLNHLVLDGVVPPSMPMPSNFEADANHALGLHFKTCHQQQSCKIAFNGLEGNWQTLIQARRNKAIHTELTHPLTQAKSTVYINDVILSSWVRMALYQRDLTPLLPLALAEATRGNYQLLYNFGALADDAVNSINLAMQFTLLCQENSAYFFNDKNIADVNFLRFPDLKPMADFCSQYLPNSHSHALTLALTPDSDPTPPVLLLSGQFDPATPPKWANEVAQQITNSRHIIVPGGHHNVMALGCTPALIKDFFTGAELDTACIENIKPKHFFTTPAGAVIKQEPTR